MIKSLKMLMVVVLLSSLGMKANTITDTLHINRDSLQTVDGVKHPFIAFNHESIFDNANARFELNVGDSLDLWVYNHDTVSHGFKIDDYSIEESIDSDDSLMISVKLNEAGVFIFYDHLNFPNNKASGCAGMLVVLDHSYQNFYWNIKDFQSTWMDSLSEGVNMDWSTYNPDYFLINGNSNPNINLDESARITGSVGDTLILNIANTGNSIHSLHFHGYHVEIVYSSNRPERVGRHKDTVGVFPMEGVIVKIVPDKPGEYPVHDHNLVATTGGNLYPNGMLTTMLITP